MFKGLITALISMMLTFFSNNAQNISHKKATYSISQGDSFFYFDSNDHITVHLYVGENPGVESEKVSKKYYFQGDANIESCVIRSSDLQEPIDITNKKYIDFGISIDPSCEAQTLSVRGEKIVHNKVVVGSKNYEAQKREPFGPIVVHNKYHNEPLFAIISAKDNNDSIYVNHDKEMYYKIINSKNELIDSESIEYIKIRSLDGEKLLIEQNGTTKVEMMEDNPTSFGIFKIKSQSRPGSARIELQASIKTDRKSRNVKTIHTVIIHKLPPKPIVATQVNLSTSTQSISPYDLGKADFSILQQDGSEADLSSIKKIDFYIAYGFFIKNDRLYDRLTIKNQTQGSIYFRANEHTRICKITMIVFLKNNKKITKELLLSVSTIPHNFISINPVQTKYDPKKGVYITSFHVMVSGKLYKRDFKVDLVSPKILYPEAYYYGFITGELEFDNPTVFYEGTKAIPFENSEQYSGRVYNEGLHSYFTTNKYDLQEVLQSSIDKLIILPNKYNTDKRILGSWDIIDKTNNNSLILKERVKEEKERLSFVIGDQTRYDPVHYTIVTINLDHTNGIYQADANNSFDFNVSYPPFMVGKDIFISIKQNDGQIRYANSFKQTLMGTELNYLNTYDCKKAICTWRITIKQKDSGERLRYSRIEQNCIGTDASYSVRSSYDILRYGCEKANDILPPKTDKNGYLFICVYPKEKITTNTETNQTKVEYKGSVSCKFGIKEEFPY